jgi:hypothetical protein
MDKKKMFIKGFKEFTQNTTVDLSEIVAIESLEEYFNDDEEEGFVDVVYVYLKSGFRIKLCEGYFNADEYCIQLTNKIAQIFSFDEENLDRRSPPVDEEKKICTIRDIKMNKTNPKD